MKKSLILLAALAASMAALAAQAAGVDLAAIFTPDVMLGLGAAGALGTTKYSHEGDVIDYVNTTGVAIASGAVVRMNDTLGVALVNIPIAGTGSVGFGVFREIPKVNATAILQGERLVWKQATQKFDGKAAATAAGDVTGSSAFAAAAAAGGTDTMLVCFTGVPGTLI